jgi:hypothetical protein
MALHAEAWRLHLAASEQGVLASQCRARRNPDRTNLETEVAAWVAKRNEANVKADWYFTTADARAKLRSFLYVRRFRPLALTRARSPSLCGRFEVAPT